MRSLIRITHYRNILLFYVYLDEPSRYLIDRPVRIRPRPCVKTTVIFSCYVLYSYRLTILTQAMLITVMPMNEQYMPSLNN